jgi:hypothetical protein
MFYKTYTIQEIEAMAYLKSENIAVPKLYHIEYFERIYHELFKIYPDLHYMYLYHKYGVDVANDTFNKNMLQVSELYTRRITNTKDSFTLLKSKSDYNPFEVVMENGVKP